MKKQIMDESIKKHKQARERFYALAMQIAAKCARQGEQQTSDLLVAMIDEMKILEKDCNFPPTDGMKVNLN